jgi:hypothetical protein
MKPLYTEIEFLKGKSRDLFSLECENCHKIFTKSKNRIQDKIQYQLKDPLAGSFCSRKCSMEGHHRLFIAHTVCEECKHPIQIYKSELKNKNFCSTKCSAIHFNNFRKGPKQKTFDFISKKSKKPKSVNKCVFCGKDTFNLLYCNGTCRNKTQNKYKNGSKSYAEKILCDKLRINFPNWTIIENNRIILNGLELDIYIPHLKLAIEWNGIYHILPIKGNESLQKIINKDNRKIELCKKLGITLITISDRTSHKKFIEETTNDLIEKLKLLK